MIRKILVVASVTLVLFTSCSLLQEVIQKPTVSYDRLELKDLSFTDATCVFHLKLTNPNPIGFSSQRIQYKLDLNQSPFFEGTFDQGITVPAQGAAPLAIPVSINFFDLFKSIQAFKGAQSIPYAFSGTIALGPFDIPFQTSGDIPVPKLPQVSLKGIQIDKLSLLGAAIVFKLNVKNNNEFAVNPKGMNYQIGLNGIDFASGETVMADSLKTGDSTVDIPLELNFLKMGKAAYQILKGGSTEYSLKGDWLWDVPKLGTQKMPFDQTGTVQLN